VFTEFVIRKVIPIAVALIIPAITTIVHLMIFMYCCKFLKVKSFTLMVIS